MKAVIFDFDGTIVDSLGAVIKVAETITKREKPFTQEEIAEYRHLDPLQIMLALGVKKWQIPKLLVQGRRMFHDHMQEVQVHKGMADVISTLHDTGVPLFVVSSNSTSNVEKYLKWHSLETYFAGIYGGAGVLSKARKLHQLFDEQHIDVDTSWYVGDETRDIIAAHSVGLKIISVSWGYNSRKALERKKPDRLVDKPKEILGVLASK